MLNNLKSRALQRGKPLDGDCKRANISNYEYGPDDHRNFCLGIMDMSTEEIIDKCRECGAYALNAKPMKEGQI